MLSAQLDALTSKLLKKDFWAGILNGAGPADGAKKYTLEELRSRYEVLERNPVVSESNRAVVVETIRSIAEFMIWGDQHEPKIFDFLMENNIMVYLHNVLQQSQNRAGDVAKQVLQTLSIVVQNIKSETGVYFLFSNNHINNIVEAAFDFEDEEVLGYYITFLKAISGKLTAQTAQFFLVAPSGEQPSSEQMRLPLYSEAIKFAHHKEGMVRAGVRTLTLSVYSVHDSHIHQVVTSQPAAQYFVAVSRYITEQLEVLVHELGETQDNYSQHALSSLDSRLAEMEDILSYCSDVLSTAHSSIARPFARTLWNRVVTRHLLKPFLSGREQSSTHMEGAICLYVLERMFCLLSYPPILNNLAMAVLGYPDHPNLPCCQPVILELLQASLPFCTGGVVRLLAAMQMCASISTELRLALGLGPLTQAAQAAPAETASPCWCFLHRLTFTEANLQHLDLLYWDVWDDSCISCQPISTHDIGVAGLNQHGSSDAAASRAIETAVEEVLQELIQQATQHTITARPQPSGLPAKLIPAPPTKQPCALCSTQSAAQRIRHDLVTALLTLLGEASASVHTLCLAGYLLCHGLLQQQASPGKTTDTTSLLQPAERQQLTSALTKAATGVGEQLEQCWPDAFFPLFQIEWSAAAAGTKQPSLAPSADQMVTGEFSRSASPSVLEALGLGPTAMQALQLCHAVQHFTVVLHICQLFQLFAPDLPGALAWMLSEMDRAWAEVLEGQQVVLSKANSVSCQVCFVPPDPIRVSLAVAGDASDVVLRYASSQQSNRATQGILAHSSPTVVLAQCANNCVDAGVVVSTAPLLGSRFYQDPKVAVWMHVLVRPSVQSLVKQVRKAAQRRGGLLGSLRNLSDGHWILQFKDGPRVLEALRLTDGAMSTATDVYKDVIGRGFVSAWLSAVMWSD